MALVDGAPSVRLEGDEKRALALIPEGRLLLQKAQSIAKLAEVPTFSMNRRVSDDEYIYVLVAGDQGIIQISAGVVVPDKITEEPDLLEPALFPDFLSGIVLNGLMDEHEETQEDGTVIRYKTIRSWAPTPGCAALQEIETGRQPSRRLAVTPYASMSEWRDPSGNRDFSQYQVPRSSQWSGTMKKVVQIVMGFGRINKNKLRDPDQPLKTTGYMKEVGQYGVQVRYDYKFMRCHGIYRAPDNKLWLIEIGAGRGVIAMLLPIYPGSDGENFRKRAEARGDDAMIKALDELGCLPTGEAFPTTPALFAKKLASGDILQLLGPGDMSDFYGRLSGFSSVCGWSFTDKGDQAHNVGYCYPEDQSDIFQKSYWYQLNIKIGALKEDREPGEPIAEGSAELRKQQEGYLWAGRADKYVIPVKYYEPMMDPPGLLSHGAAARFPSAVIQKECNGPVYVGIVDGELKTARYFHPGKAEFINNQYDERDGEPCLYSGSWSWRSEQGLATLPRMPYTNDIDKRAILVPTVSFGTLTVKPSGFGGAYGVVYIDRPQYVHIYRARFFESHIITETQSGESRSACFVNPGYLRDGYYFFEGRRFDARNGSEGVTYPSLVDPNQGISWSMIFGGLPGGPPRSGCDGCNCGCKHWDPKIMCAFYSPSVPCAEYADAGVWLTPCQPSYAFSGSGIRGPGWGTSWDNGHDFQGTWNFVGSSNGIVSGPVPEVLHDYAMLPSPDPETGSVQQLFALRSAIGEDCVMHTRGFNVTQVTTGYVPVPDAGMGAFIGVNQP